MATIVALDRVRTNVLTYPPGFSHAACGCRGCRGQGGNCIQAIAADQLVVSFRLDDGRTGVVTVASGAGAPAIRAAIAAWATANPLAVDPVAGSTVP